MNYRLFPMFIALTAGMSRAGAMEFTAITYNIQARPILDRADIKIPQIAPLLDIYSVAGIQECFDKCRLLKHSKLPHQFIFDKKLPQKSTGSGLAMLTGFKVLKQDAINFTDAVKGSADYMASKGVLMVSLDLGGDGVLDVYTTHLHAGSAPAVVKARQSQMRQMAAFVKANSPDTHSVILMGDMNSRPPRDPASLTAPPDDIEKAENAVFQELLDSLKLKNAQDVLFGPVKQNIDHILYRPAKGKTMTPLSWSEEVTRFVNKKGAWLSDHPPIVVKFSLQ